MAYRSRRIWAALSLALTVILHLPIGAQAQTRSAIGYQDPPELKVLIAQAMAGNPRIAAARLHWQAQSKVPIQAATLPDPQLTLQPFSVGSPLPGAGLTTSDFAYTGFGATQSIPFPTKLRLASTIAQKDADYAAQQVSETRREVREKVRDLYFELFYHTRLIAALNVTGADLEQITQAAQARYQVGRGPQYDLIAAQLRQTQLLKELAMHHEQEHQVNLEMKAELGRDPDSADIEAGNVAPSRIAIDAGELRKLTLARAPELRMLRIAAQSGKNKLKLGGEGYRPDFSIGYMYQKTGPGFRDYYMLSLGATVPLYFWRKETPAVQQAALELDSARRQEEAGELEIAANAESALIALRTTERVIKIYREGLLPQSRASKDSAFAAYQTGNADFQTLISSLTGLLDLQQEYYRAIADHEIAAARIEHLIEEDQ